MIPKKESNILIRSSEQGNTVFNLVSGSIFQLDETGIGVLNLCDGKHSDSDIAQKTQSSLQEVQAFLSDLEQLGLIYFVDPDIAYELKKISHIDVEDEISRLYDLKITYTVGDRTFKSILIDMSFVHLFYLLASKDKSMVGLSEVFILEELDPDMLFFYQPHLLQREYYAQNARLIVEEILKKAEELGKKKVEALNMFDEEIQKTLARIGFFESRKVVMWDLNLEEHAASSKLEKNVRYYERKAEKDNVVIRPITKEDVPRLVDLYRSFSKIHKKDLYTVCFGNPEIFEKLFELEGFDSELCLLAEKDEALLGYHVWMWRDAQNAEWWISRIDHDNPEASKYGVIDLLFSRITKKLREKGAVRVSLGWNDLSDQGLCYYKWKWGGIPTQCFSFMRKVL